MVPALKEIQHVPRGTYREPRGQTVTSVQGTEMPKLVPAVAKTTESPP